MPKGMEEALKREAMEKFGSIDSPEARAYIYGTMRKSGWIPNRERSARRAKNPATRKIQRVSV